MAIGIVLEDQVERAVHVFVVVPETAFHEFGFADPAAAAVARVHAGKQPVVGLAPDLGETEGEDVDVRFGEAVLEQAVELGGHVAHVVKRAAEDQAAIGVLINGPLEHGFLDQPVVDQPVIVGGLLPETEGLLDLLADRVGVVVVQVLPAGQACDLLARRIEIERGKIREHLVVVLLQAVAHAGGETTAHGKGFRIGFEHRVPREGERLVLVEIGPELVDSGLLRRSTGGRQRGRRGGPVDLEGVVHEANSRSVRHLPIVAPSILKKA